MAKSHDQTAAPSRRRVIKAAGVLAAALAAPAVLRIGSAFAAYPDRPIKIVVANTPGGPSDIIARIMAAAMQEAIGGSVIVENKGGAGGNIGMGFVARAEPDGYTILLTDQRLFGQSRPLQHAAVRSVQGFRRRSASSRSRRTCSR